MIIAYNSDLTSFDEVTFKRKLKALEISIRAYTHNDFNFRSIRFQSEIKDGVLALSTDMINVNDTIEISNSKYNDGIYNVEDNDSNFITLDTNLYDEENPIVITLVRYDENIKNGCLELLNWEYNNINNVGVASESISRHSVSYVTRDANNTLMNYPIELFGFLKPYIRART